MPCDRHELFRQSIDRLLVGECPADEEQALHLHLQSCGECQRSLAGSRRVIDSLQAFAFDVDPALERKVLAAMGARAAQLEAKPLGSPRVLPMFLVAVVLTMVGSLLELQFGTLVATLLDIEGAQARRALLDLWIVPSTLVLLLFPILPLLSKGSEPVTERNL